MAGKADLVNSIVDPAVEAHRIPFYDGWGVASESEEDWGDASLQNTPPPDGSIRVGSGGGGGAG
jgi:hypothetical protein